MTRVALLSDFLDTECRVHFDGLLELLTNLGINYEVDPRLVRGFDYYTRTAFEVHSPSCRYVWPSELDLMARLAGLELRGRFGDWDREPFTSESTSHVSVWEKPC